MLFTEVPLASCPPFLDIFPFSIVQSANETLNVRSANDWCESHLRLASAVDRLAPEYKIFREILHSLGSHRHEISLYGAANKAVYTREDFTGD